MTSEFDYIAWLRQQKNDGPPHVMVGPGDDCAVVRVTTGLQLLTTDMLMDGVDFEVANVEPRRIGRKAMAVNLSDIAAMAGVPRTARGFADMVALTRAQLADPDLGVKLRAGRSSEITHCIRLNQGCLGRGSRGLPVSCTVSSATSPDTRRVTSTSPLTSVNLTALLTRFSTSRSR